MEGTSFTRDMIEKNGSELSEIEKQTLIKLIDDCPSCMRADKHGEVVRLYVDGVYHFQRCIVLKNCTGFPVSSFDEMDFSGCDFRHLSDGTYSMSGEWYRFDSDDSCPFALRFDDLEVEMKIYSACDIVALGTTPWEYLFSVAGAILEKSDLPGDHLNEREAELLPLLRELEGLDLRWMMGESEFPIFKGYATKYGFGELLRAIENVEKTAENEKARQRVRKKLVDLLNCTQYEHLWREIYDLLSASQEGYPSLADVYCEEPPIEMRAKIQSFMQENGYSGEYPDFVKRGRLKGARLASSYGTQYFVGAEKNVVHRIRCVEYYFDGHAHMTFLCGAQLLREGEKEGDIFSCMFNGKGRRYFKSFSMMNADQNEADLSVALSAAIKKAELKRLKKEERRATDTRAASWYISYFLTILILGGGIFGVIMTAAFALLSVGIAALFSGVDGVVSVMSNFPLWHIFGFCSISFGLWMGIIGVSAERK